MLVETCHRITGPHLLLSSTGAAIWLRDVEEAELSRIMKRVEEAAIYLSWSIPKMISNDIGVSISIAAPVDQLYAACLLLEWGVEHEPWSREVLEKIRNEEVENLSLRVLYEYCVQNELSCTIDEDAFCFGYGKQVHNYTFGNLPSIESLPPIEKIPTVGITGTNGKTTTTRMLAYIAQSAGFCVGTTSSDGVVIDGEYIVEGDWTGAGAARKVLRHPDVDFAILETARGGLMRRGMVIHDLDVVGITNVSADHFGFWGVNSLAMLRRAKLSITRALKKGGVLVLNREHSELYTQFREEFALERPDIQLMFYSLEENRADEKNAVVYCRAGGIYIAEEWICDLKEIPLTIGGLATYNVENALLATALAYCHGVSNIHIRFGLLRMQADNKDSAGRSNIFSYNGAKVIVDFAHNEAGMRAMVKLVQALEPKRSFMVFGQAGDRDEFLLKGLASAAGELNCHRYFIKGITKHNEEKSSSQIIEILYESLNQVGIHAEQIVKCQDEITATQKALSVLDKGDILLLLTHTHYQEVISLVQANNQ